MIADVVAEQGIVDEAATALVDRVRLPSGDRMDDVAIVVVRLT